ncbi:MAG: hypothetical protein IKJ94_06000 [Oscillospiraceae bacterium]|nr:hypothetical protein [Oscillospiraceae bacterium]
MKELKQYYRDISKHLPVGRKQKQQILLTITQSVEDYLAAHPLADFQAVQAHFGSPQEIAAAYIENMTTPEILKKFRFRKTVLTILCATAATALLLWGVVVGTALINEITSSGGYGVIDPIEEFNVTEYN